MIYYEYLIILMEYYTNVSNKNEIQIYSVSQHLKLGIYLRTS